MQGRSRRKHLSLIERTSIIIRDFIMEHTDIIGPIMALVFAEGSIIALLNAV